MIAPPHTLISHSTSRDVSFFLFAVVIVIVCAVIVALVCAGAFGVVAIAASTVVVTVACAGAIVVSVVSDHKKFPRCLVRFVTTWKRIFIL